MPAAANQLNALQAKVLPREHAKAPGGRTAWRNADLVYVIFLLIWRKLYKYSHN